MLSVFPAHAPADATFARELSAFLDSGGNVVCFTPDASIKPGEDLLDTAESGCSADVLLLLLSAASNPPGWRRDRWEPILLSNPVETGTHVAVFLLEECSFPKLLRRGSGFFDATADGGSERSRLAAMRRLKRWLRSVPSGTFPAMNFSTDLEELYRCLDDQPGTLTVSAALADRFAREASRDFEAVFWIPACGRTLAQIAGELGAQLEMTLDGTLADNCGRIRDVLAAKRCLVVFDAPQIAIDAMMPFGRTSVLLTGEPFRTAQDVPTMATARMLVAKRRFAEAYELLHRLLDSGAEPESCARDLIWICEHWDRVDEANALRFRIGPAPSEQLRLF